MLSREWRLRMGVAVLRYGIPAVAASAVFVVLRGIIVTASDPVMWPLTLVLIMAAVMVGCMVCVLVG
jgi:hypothetical protein